jgi:hypothetical protein
MDVERCIRPGLAVLILLCSAVVAEDMYLTMDDGTEIVLHDDYSWSFAKSSSTTSIDEDVGITMQDGESIVVSTSGQWGYQDPVGSGSGNQETAMQSAYATGMAQHQDLGKAHQAAVDEATKRLLKNLSPIVAGGTQSREHLLECLKKAEQKVESADQKLGDQWKVTITIKLQRQGILDFATCSRESGGDKE